MILIGEGVLGMLNAKLVVFLIAAGFAPAAHAQTLEAKSPLDSLNPPSRAVLVESFPDGARVPGPVECFASPTQACILIHAYDSALSQRPQHRRRDLVAIMGSLVAIGEMDAANAVSEDLLADIALQDTSAFRLGDIFEHHLSAGNFEKAIEILYMFPSGRPPAFHYLRSAAAVLLDAMSVDEALDLVSKEFPEALRVHGNLSIAYESLANGDVSVARDIVSNMGNEVATNVLEVNILIEAAKSEASTPDVEELKKIANTNPEMAYRLYIFALDRLRQEGYIEDAHQMVSEVLLLNLDGPEAPNYNDWCSMALVDFLSEDFGRARSHLLEIEDDLLSNCDYHVIRTLSKEGNYELAWDLLREQTTESRRQAFGSLLEEVAEAGNTGLAERLMRWADSVELDTRFKHSILASAYVRAGMLDSALATADLAGQQRDFTLLNMVSVLAERGQLKDAVEISRLIEPQAMRFRALVSTVPHLVNPL